MRTIRSHTVIMCPSLFYLAANLLLDHTAQRIKLADFGAAELLEEKRMSSDRIHGDLGAGTLCYNPPEVSIYLTMEIQIIVPVWFS